jgi:Zn-dependent peptidase ImmA (M78 family)
MKLYSVLGRYVEFPKLNLPQEIPGNTTPEDTAKYLREFWGIKGPIHNIIHWMERNGICVASLPTGTEKIDAFSQTAYNGTREVACVVLGSEKESAVRRQFCAAHEIGHILMHESVTDVEALSSAEFREKENEAHDFAGAFLLPAEDFIKDLVQYDLRLDTFIPLKRKWHVSIGAMIIRAKKLGVIDSITYTRLMKSYSARGWRTSEPLDNQITIESPILGQKAIDVLLENDVFSVSELFEELSKNGVSLNAGFVEEALCLEKGTLSVERSDHIQPLEVVLKKK